jgi:glutamate-ammonia-ligase adenylyltransferase
MTLEALDRVIDAIDRSPEIDGLPAEIRPLVASLVRGPAPRESLLGLRRLLERDPQRAWPSEAGAVRTLSLVLSSGPELGRLLARDPSRVDRLLDPRLSRPRSKAELEGDLRRRLAPALDDEQLALQIAAFRNDHYVRLAACEFSGVALEQVGLELANLADVCLDLAIEQAIASVAARHGSPLLIDDQGRQQPCGLAVVAMGKYGAQELNFCSDIDLVLIYASDQGQAGDLSLHEFFTAVSRRVIRVLSQPSAEGLAFRVDLRLRPEGSQGPLCNAVASAERYYETWGGPYDRLAWLKARPAAGDLVVGEQLIEILHPFVFPRAIRPEIVGQLHQLTRRIRDELGRDDGWDVKLGEGGIRDIEFFVQALQLLHAGKQPALQERATLRALDKLLFAGLIADREHRVLAEAYELYRRLEHRLQLHGGRQTHHLPATGALRQRIVAHLGFDAARFPPHLQSLRRQVCAIYATLGEPPRPASWLAQLVEVDLKRAPLDEAGRRTLAQRLAHNGFAQPDRALQQLRALSDKPWGPFGRAPSPVARRLAEPLLSEICRSPDPDAALGHLVELSLRFGPFDGLWAMLGEHPEALRLLCNLFGTSDLLARMFINHPELLDRLLGAGHAGPPPGPQQLAQELSRRLAQVTDLGVLLERCRRFRNDELLRIGLQDIAGDLDLEGVWQQLSALADVLLAQIYPAVLAEVVQRYGAPCHDDGSLATMAVIALGDPRSAGGAKQRVLRPAGATLHQRADHRPQRGATLRRRHPAAPLGQPGHPRRQPAESDRAPPSA